MITVRHPLMRIYSAWHDKFLKNGRWVGYIKDNFGIYLAQLEQRDMTNDLYQYSFEAFVELLALSKGDFIRDRHWTSIRSYCGTCTLDYDFITQQETADTDQSFLLKLLGMESLHVPDKYTESLSIEQIAAPYANVSRSVLENVYANYFP